MDALKEKDDQLLWTVSETARQLDVCQKTVHRLINKGAFPAVRYGRRIYLSRESILDWVKSQTRYNLGCVETTCVSTGEKPCQSLNVEMERVKTTTFMSDVNLEKRLSDLQVHVING